MCIALVGQFMGAEGSILIAGIMVAVSMLSGASSAIGWAAFGKLLQRWLKSPRRLKVFNLSMAGIIVAGVAFILWSGLGA